MSATTRILLPAVLLAGLPASAHAHLGHVGDLAGHSHWLGYGALVAAAAALALLPKKRKQEPKEQAEAEQEAEGEKAA